MKKFANIFFVLAFVGSLFLVPYFIYSRGIDNQVAYYENRTLAATPSFTAQELIAGSYNDQIETWLTDHMPLREQLLTFHTWLDINLFGQPVVNEVIVGDILLPYNNFGEWDLDYLTPLAQDSVALQLQIPTLLEDWGGVYCYVGIPLQNTYFNSAYPDYTAGRGWHIEGMRQAFALEANAQGLPFLDMMTVFEDMGMPDYLYAKSDHHYSYYGAFVTYQSIMDYLATTYTLDLPVLTEDDMDITALDIPFLGSRNRKIYDLWNGEEALYIGTQVDEVPFERWDNGTEVASTLYTIPTDVVTYDTYMGGDKAQTCITTNRPELPNLLIFGDSFTNPLETLLYTGFNETRSIDLRYYTQEGILSYITDYQPDVVLDRKSVV